MDRPTKGTRAAHKLVHLSAETMPPTLPKKRHWLLHLLLTGLFLLLISSLAQQWSAPPQQQMPSKSAWNADEKDAAEFLLVAEDELLKAKGKMVAAFWNYATNMTDYNEQKKWEEESAYNALQWRLSIAGHIAQKDTIRHNKLQRKLKMLVELNNFGLPDDKYDMLTQSLSQMEKIYQNAVVVNRTDTTQLVHRADVMKLLEESRDPDEMLHYWKALNDEIGRKMRKHFVTVIELANEEARLGGLKDGAELKNFEYGSPEFMDDVVSIWEEIKPLYQKLHSYIRHKLQERYGKSLVRDNTPVPVHLMQWKQQVDFLKPYPSKHNIDVTDQMKAQGWTVKKLYQVADDFYQSLGLDPMPQEFWKESLIEAPTDGRGVDCHGSAHDFYNGKDFRIKMCTKVSQSDFYSVTHEMGHIQYFMSFRNQTFLFRGAPLAALNEGVADIASLSVGTTGYLKQIGLLPNSLDEDNIEANINALFNSAMLKLRWMPANYMFDKFRWDLYTGKVSLEDLNCHWVRLSAEIQGVIPPVMRSEADFDGGSIYHMANDIPIIQYFVAFVYQFQFYRELCLEANQYEPGNKDKPLYRCNLYGSKEAGRKLYKMLSLGASKPWQQVIAVLTGEPRMSAQPFLEYFAPLEEWLDQYIESHKLTVGWEVPDYSKLCTNSGEDGDKTSCTLDTC